MTELRREHDALRNWLPPGEDWRAEGLLMRAAQEWRGTFDAITDFVSVLDNEYRIVRANRALADYLGKRPEELLVFRDITRQKQAEEALRQSELKFRTLAEESPNMIFINKRGKVVFANKLCEEVMGYRREEFYAPEFDFMGLIAPEYHELVKENFRKHLHGENIAPFEYALIDRAGRRIETIITTRLVDFEGEHAILGIVTDITERKRAEQALRESEEKFSKSFHNNPTVMALVTLDKALFLDVNDSFQRILGYSREEAIGHSAFELGIWVDPAQRREFIRLLREQGTAPARVVQMRTKSGQVRTMLWGGTLITVGGEKLLLGTASDITEQQRLQEQLNQAHKMEVIGRLAGGVAHDFNNMLAVILGYTEMLMESCRADLDRHVVKTIESAAIRSRDLVRQLLAFSRKQLISPKPLDLNTAITESHKLLGRVIGEDIKLVLQLAGSLGTILLDPAQFDQILFNLAANARDAMAKGGELVLTTANVELDKNSCPGIPHVNPGPYVLLSAQDNGCGMDQETLAHIFEPFYTTKGVGKGTGMGLATVYGIIKQNNGYIDVESQPGHGTVFRLYFPQLTADAAGAPPPAREIAGPWSNGSGTILLVEDDEMLRHLLVSMASGLGYHIFVAASAEEAITIFEQEKASFDLLVTDIILTGMNGKELSDRLTAKQPRLKTLFISGYTADVLAHRGVLDADAHLLAKPFGNDELAWKIKELMDAPMR